MPSEKRQRQRENSRARQEAAIAAQKQSQQRTRILLVGGIALVLIVAVVWAMQGGDDKKDTKVAADKTTTTAKASSSTTAAGGGAAGDPNTCPPSEGTATRHTTFASAPKMCIDVNKKYSALVKTDVGNFTIEFNAKQAPNTVNNFVFLARNHFYDGVIYHRVIPGFMVQGGDPEGTGSGGPGYSIPDEFSTDHKFAVGDVAMAKTPAPNSGGSQFFVVIGPQGESLPPQYTWFGKVVDGIETVEKIESDGDENADADGTGTVLKATHHIVSVTITEE